MAIGELIATLDKLERMHKSLLELAIKKTDYIKANDMKQLDELLKSEQSHVAAIETLEKLRQQYVTAYFKGKDLTIPESPSVSTVIDLVQGDEKLKLMALRERMMTLLANLKEQNDLNQKLIFESLKFVNMSLNLVQPQRQSASSFNYSSSEVRGDASVAKKTFYDSQA